MAGRYRRVTAALLAAVLAASTVACGSSTAGGGGNSTASVADSPRKAENKLVLIAADDPGTMDYVTSNLTALALWIPGNVVEPLLHLDAKGKPGPGVAEKWDVDKNQTKYTFHLRKASFSDGAPITADDVVYSLTTMKDSPVGLNKGPYAAVQKITATDPSTVEVTLSRPSVAFVEGMAGIAGSIQPKAAAKSIASKPIGSGPYVIKEYTPNNHIVFTANPKYWGQKAAIGEIEVRFVNDATAALNALKAGEADAYPFVGQELWERMTKEGLDKAMTLQTYPQGGSLFFLNFNSTKAPYNNADFRHALVKSVDRQQFVDLFNAPWGIVPTCDLVGPDAASTKDCVDTFDLAGAKSALQASGLASSPVEFTSVTDIGNLVGPADLAVADFQATGVKVDRTQLDLARYSQVVFSGTPPQYGVTVMTTEYNLTQMASCPDPAKVGWKTYCDKDITKLLADADAAGTQQERDQLFAKAQRKLQQDAVIVPLMASKGVGLLNKQLQGWKNPTVNIAIDLAGLHW